MGKKEEVIEQECKQLLIALGFVHFAAVQQLTRAQAVSKRVEDQVLHTDRKQGRETKT